MSAITSEDIHAYHIKIEMDISSQLDTLKTLAENLARSFGHATSCPISHCQHRCDCGSTESQSTALLEYERWKREHAKQREKEK